MHVIASRSIAAATSLALLFAPLTATAQTVQVQVTPYQPQQPVYVQQAPPPPADAQAGNGQYVAPLQQQTQQTYVPQSVALSGPRVIKDWHEGEPIPPGYHPATRVRGGLIGGGIGMFAPAYIVSILIAGANADNGSANALWIPVLGPFVQMGQVGGSNCDSSCQSTADIGLVLDGALQAAGLAMFIYGVAVPKTVLVRNDLGVFKNVMATPLVGRSFTGIGLTGQF